MAAKICLTKFMPQVYLLRAIAEQMVEVKDHYNRRHTYLQHKNEDLSKESKFPGSIDDADRIRI
jgi:hypothetical protein